MKRYLLALTAAIITAGSCLYAQKNENQTLLNAALHGWEYEVRAGISIGGSSPLPLPAEIRSIDSYNPTLAIMLEGNAIKWFGAEKKWGLNDIFQKDFQTISFAMYPIYLNFGFGYAS